MSETLFEFDERNYLDCQSSYRGPRNQEYYLGDYVIEGGSNIDVRADKVSIGPCSLIKMYSSARQFFRRSWSHIREDATDVTVLWFVTQGQISISHQNGNSVAGTGDCAVTRSMTPFYIECRPGSEGAHEAMHLIIPTHLIRRFVPDYINTGFTIPADKREFQLARDLLAYAYEGHDNMPEDVAQHLIESVVAILGNAVRLNEGARPSRETVSDLRLRDVLRYIENHLSDPGLSIASVADGCGISQRYTSYLLKLHGTSFSHYVWEQRLKMAAQWIASPEQADVSISEIAYRVGFKSPAHFSRMFKREYKLSPSRYRTAHVMSSARERDYLFTEKPEILQ